MSSKYNCAIEILKILNDKNFDAYIIGGYPRDFYLGKINDDIDICTSADYNDLKNIFDVKNNKYGSYILYYKDFSFEVTTFRKEKNYFNNRFPGKVSFTNSLVKDLKRRDFTINTLCIDLNGNFVDLLNSRLDINHKIIRLIGSEKKISDDSLRILRAIRFATVLDFKIDDKISDAIFKYKDNLFNLSFDRKKRELEKIFSSYNCLYGFSLIHYYGLEKYLHINIDDIVVVPDLCGMWAQVLIDDSYNFSKADKFKIFKIRELLDIPFDIYDLYKYGPGIFSVVSSIRKDGLDIIDIYDKLVIKDRDDIDISFFDICDVLSVNDQLIKVIYSDIEKKILYGQLRNNKSEILKYIKKNYECLK